MAAINREVLKKIQNKLEVSESRAYALVAEKARATHLPRHLAAVALAADAGINVSKKAYATDDERALIRAAARPPDHPIPATPISVSPAATTSPARHTRPLRRRSAPPRKSNSVMVVHGRNMAMRDSMYAFLRALGLSPIEFVQGIKATKKGAPVIPEVLDAMFRSAAAVVVLLTPDDEAKLKKQFWKSGDLAHERKLTGQSTGECLV